MEDAVGKDSDAGIYIYAIEHNCPAIKRRTIKTFVFKLYPSIQHRPNYSNMFKHPEGYRDRKPMKRPDGKSFNGEELES